MAPLLDKLADRSALSIDWDAANVRVVQIRVSRADVKVSRAMTAPLPAELSSLNDAEGIGRFIRRLLDQQGVAIRRAMVDVPRHQVILNSIELPDAPTEELVSMVRFQVAKDLPFAQDSAILDFVKTGLTGENDVNTSVLVAAIRDDALEFYRQVCSAAGLKISRAGLRPYATSIGVLRAMPDTAHGRTLIIDVGAAMTEIDLIRDGHLVFSRSVEVRVEAPSEPAAPANDDPDPDVLTRLGPKSRSPVDDLLVQITRSLAGMRATDPHAEPQRVVIAGATGIEAELAEAMRNKLNVPVDLFDPAPLLGSSVPAGQPELRGFASAIGLAITQSLDPVDYFDFLHPKKEVTVRQKQMRKMPLVAATVVVALVGAVFAYNGTVTPKRQKIKRLNAEISDLKKRLEDVDELGDQLADLRSWRDGTVIAADELERLFEAFPDTKKVFATQVRITSKNQIKVQVQTKENDGPNEFARKLQDVKDDEGEQYYTVKPGKSTSSQGDYAFRSEVVATPKNKIEDEKPTRRKRRR